MNLNNMVEMVRIELTSENSLELLSTSVVNVRNNTNSLKHLQKYELV